jgi:hypothetical protein
LKLRRVVESVPALNELAGNSGVKTGAAWRVALYLKKCNELLELYQEQVLPIFEEHGEPLPDGGGYRRHTKDPEKQRIFDEVHEELLDQEVDIDPPTIKLSELGETTRPSLLMVLDYMIESDL